MLTVIVGYAVIVDYRRQNVNAVKILSHLNKICKIQVIESCEKERQCLNIGTSCLNILDYFNSTHKTSWLDHQKYRIYEQNISLEGTQFAKPWNLKFSNFCYTKLTQKLLTWNFHHLLLVMTYFNGSSYVCSLTMALWSQKYHLRMTFSEPESNPKPFLRIIAKKVSNWSFVPIFTKFGLTKPLNERHTSRIGDGATKKPSKNGPKWLQNFSLHLHRFLRHIFNNFVDWLF